MADRKLIFRHHAIKRMFDRSITVDDVRAVLANGEIIKSYPDDTPYPSRLMLGTVAGKNVHVVAADIPDSHESVIITVYEPDPQIWVDGFRRRRQR